MKLRDILFERANPTKYDLSNVPQSLGVKLINIDYTFTYEEEQAIKSTGMTVPSIGMKYDGDVPKVPVVYSHVLQQDGNEGLMHAIKMRHDDHVMHDGLIDQMIEASVTSIFGNGRIVKFDGMKGHGPKQRAIEIMRMAASKYKPIIVPMPSSSPLTKMFASKIAEHLGTSVADVLVKHPFPEKSKMIKTVGRGYEQSTDTSPSPADRYRSAQASLTKINQRLKTLYASEDVTDEMIDEIDQLESKSAELEASIDPSSAKFAKKSLQSAGGTSRRYYDYIRHNQDVGHLNKRHIIMVDDNIVTGETLAEAVKSFIRAGIVPHLVGCVCIHKYL